MTDADDSAHSLGDYLRLVFLDPVTLAGLVVLLAGIALVVVSDPSARVRTPVLGGSLMLVGTVLFALGYTRAQWGLRRWGR
ncbi:hypothetical protein [Haladaptatus salinisoli]|uniref:hypothetical protein n=1 Tax=Haladaptatus salinisoli TaxID=2884876 RepID=UPI001D0B290D|nr:hypothetical protein [Haladaptatus salinisoli]